MKKHFLLIVTFIIFSLPAFSQAFYSFSLGTSIPTSQFSDQNIEEGGYAKVGYYGEGEGGYFFSSSWGIGLQSSFQLHDVDQNALKRDYQIQLANISNVAVKTGEYKTVTILAGPHYKWDITPDWDLTFKGMIGGMVNFSDDITITTTPLQPDREESQTILTPKNELSFAYGGGVNISYLFPSKVGINFKLQMNGSRIIQTELLNGVKTYESGLKMLFVNIGIGLEFH